MPVLPPTLAHLLPPELHALCESASCASGLALFLAGDIPRWMFFVVRGEVVLERHGLDGQPACLQRCQHGFVGEASLTASHYHCDGRVTQPAHVIQVPIVPLRDALKRDPVFALRWMDMLSREVRHLRLQNERLSLLRVQDRLLHLIETEGVAGCYPLQGSLKALARQLAVTHEALYRALAQAVSRGLLKRTEQALVLTAQAPAPSPTTPR